MHVCILPTTLRVIHQGIWHKYYEYNTKYYWPWSKIRVQYSGKYNTRVPDYTKNPTLVDAKSWQPLPEPCSWARIELLHRALVLVEVRCWNETDPFCETRRPGSISFCDHWYREFLIGLGKSPDYLGLEAFPMHFGSSSPTTPKVLREAESSLSN